jgi:predicted ferric reductase
MLKTKLFDGPSTIVQQLIISFWLANFGAVLLLWATTTQFTTDVSLLLHNFGLLFGLVATFFALTQFMLMGRIAWIERNFGLEHLASYHRLNGYLAITFIVLHPIFITASHSLESSRNFLGEYVYTISHEPYVWMALIAEILFLTVVVSSMYIARKHLKFETWYFVHLMVYAAIVLVPFHQLSIGSSFVGGYHPLARVYWIGLYAFVLANLLVWRFGLPLFNYLVHGFRIERVVAETPTTTSLYIRVNNLSQWRSRPGQFVLVRIFVKGLWWQEHPFSLSWIPHDNLLRLTIRHVGDYTQAIAKLRPGARVLVSGPYGRFTREVAQTDKRLFIAGGVGITPLRSMIEETVQNKIDSILIYANRTPDDVVFAGELAALAGKHLKIVQVFSEPSQHYRGHTGYVGGALVKKLVADAAERDIYVCGPPPMMEGLLADFADMELPSEQIHYERFALHN